MRQKSNFKHGHSRGGHVSKAMRVWRHMIERCCNPHSINFERYGARGITVCDRWKVFTNWLEDMGEPPDGLTLERIKNDGNYEPANVKWDTIKNQCRNKRNNVMVTIGGVTTTLIEICERFGKPISLARKRLRKGWPADRAIFEKSRRDHH